MSANDLFQELKNGSTKNIKSVVESLNLVKCNISKNEFKFDNVKETSNFIYYYTNHDSRCVPDISNALDSNFARICNDLESHLNEKIDVKIYPDLKSFHKHGAREARGEDWFVGTAIFGDIRIVSPLNPGPKHNYDSIIKVVVHEVTHKLIDNIAGERVPRWLHEGVAGFEAEQMDDKRREYLAKNIKLGNIPSFKEMNCSFENVGGYEFSYTMVDYIVKSYGMKKIVELIKSSCDISKVLGVSCDDFRNHWVEFLKKNYAKI